MSKIMSEYNEPALHEQLAEFLHKEWASWMFYLFSKSNINDKGCTIPLKWVGHWTQKMRTPFKALANDERHRSYEQAHKLLELLKQYESKRADAEEDIASEDWLTRLEIIQRVNKLKRRLDKLEQSKAFAIKRLETLQTFINELPEPYSARLSNILANGRPAPNTPEYKEWNWSCGSRIGTVMATDSHDAILKATTVMLETSASGPGQGFNMIPDVKVKTRK